MLVKIASVPSINDFSAALAKVKNRKAPSSSRILPEMFKVSIDNLEFYDFKTQLVGSKRVSSTGVG